MVDVPAGITTEASVQANLAALLRRRASVEELAGRLVRSAADRDLPGRRGVVDASG